MDNKRQYNYIYRHLVESNNDLVGLVAYGIYKQHKIEFLESFKKDKQRDPSDEECNVFYLTSTTPDQLLKYRDQAENLVSDIVMNTTLEEIQDYEREMLQGYEGKIVNAVKNNMPSGIKNFWNGVLGSVIGAFVFSAIAACFYFIGLTSDKATHQLVNKVIEAKECQPSKDFSPDSLNQK